MVLLSVAVKVAVACVCPTFQISADSTPPTTVIPVPLARLANVASLTFSENVNVTSELLLVSLSEASTMLTITEGLAVSTGAVSVPLEPRLPATSV